MSQTEEDTFNALRRTPFKDVLVEMYQKRGGYAGPNRQLMAQNLYNFVRYLLIELNVIALSEEDTEYEELAKHYWTLNDFKDALDKYLKQVDDVNKMGAS